MDIWIKQDKFHQIVLKKIYIAPLHKEECTIRNLLCYYQELACQEYGSEAKMEQALLELYDAKFKVVLVEYGIYSLFIYSLTAPDPKYLQDENYTLDLLKASFEGFCIPKMNQKSAVKSIFERAVEIYESDLKSVEESTIDVSYQRMISHFFKDTSRDYNSFGSLDELHKITPKQLFDYYLKVVKEEMITIGTGNYPAFKNINKIKVKPKTDYFFQMRNSKLSPIIHESYPSNQCYLYLVYDLNIFSKDKLYFACRLFNHILGGDSSSYLFRIIREELGLCYSVQSIYYSTMGILVIFLVIEEKNIEQSMKAIESILKHLREEDIALEYAKAYETGLIQIGEDSIDTAIYNYLKDTYFLDYPKSSELIQNINSVKQDDIIEVMNQLKKPFVYILGGKNGK